jgi:hypothetical protein
MLNATASEQKLREQFRERGVAEQTVAQLKVTVREGGIATISGQEADVCGLKQVIGRNSVRLGGVAATVSISDEPGSHPPGTGPTVSTDATRTIPTYEQPASPGSNDNAFEDAFGFDDAAMPEFSLEHPGRTDVSVEDVAAFLRKQPDDSATYRNLGLYFRASEVVRRHVETNPLLFTMVGDRVKLSDPHKKEALKKLSLVLTAKPYYRKHILPEQVHEHVHNAAQLAFSSNPAEVRKLLLEVSRLILKKPGMKAHGLYAANMPLVLACLVDRVVMLERAAKGKSRVFANALGPMIHKLIFKKWTLGVVQGSQFLSNLLLTWERMGCFQPKHLEEPLKAVWLLAAYGGADGVADEPQKSDVTGWYKLVQRDSTVPLDEYLPIASKKTKLRESVAADESAAEPRTGDVRGRTLHAAAQMQLGPKSDIVKSTEKEEPPAKRQAV